MIGQIQRRTVVDPVTQDLRAAQAEAQATGQMVCQAFRPDGTPTFFVMPRDADDAEISQRAFAIRRGRPMTEGEKVFDSLLRIHGPEVNPLVAD